VSVRVVQMTVGQLQEQLKKDGKDLPEVALRALRGGARHGEQFLASESPVDLGAYKAAWRTEDVADGAHLNNTAPYAGVIEDGARPHEVSKGTIAAVAAWAERHGFENAWAFAVSWAKKVAAVGIPARNIVRDRLGRLRGFVGEEFGRMWANRFSGGAVGAATMSSREVAEAHGLSVRQVETLARAGGFEGAFKGSNGRWNFPTGGGQ